MKKIISLTLILIFASTVFVSAADKSSSVSDIIAYVLIGIGTAAIIASIIILKKKKNEMIKKK